MLPTLAEVLRPLSPRAVAAPRPHRTAEADGAQSVSDEDREIIEAIRREREEDARFFSNQPEMERWVVGEFLARLGVDFHPDEIQSQPEHDNVDVVFRGGSFQVKEICDPNERRDDRVRKLLKLAREAVTAEDLDPPVVGRDIVLSDLRDEIFAVASSFRYPPRERASLDLLCYVTRPYCGFNEPASVVGEKLGGLGWRSISCLHGWRSYVLVASFKAPSFLRDR